MATNKSLAVPSFSEYRRNFSASTVTSQVIYYQWRGMRPLQPITKPIINIATQRIKSVMMHPAKLVCVANSEALPPFRERHNVAMHLAV